MGQHHPFVERQTVAGIHIAADPVRMAGSRIADSCHYQEAYTAGNYPVLEVDLAGKRLAAPSADRHYSRQEAAVPLVLHHLHRDFASC
jgi:hypothetical protein